MIKSLALSKIMYVTGVLIPDKCFIDKIKSEMIKFIWSGRVPKVAYKVLLHSKERGGIGLPDVHSRVKAQQINIITRLVSGVVTPWKIIPSWFLDPYGGIKNVRSSFDIKMMSSFSEDSY